MAQLSQRYQSKIRDQNLVATNHNAYRGYLTSVADVLGRAYTLTAEYKF